MSGFKKTDKSKVIKSRNIPKEHKGAVPEENKRSFWLFVFVIFFFTLLLYSNTLTHKYALDDKTVIKENQYVLQGIDSISVLLTKAYWYGYNGLNEGSYRPLPLLTHAVEYEFLKENPAISHLINVTLYAFTGILLFVTLTKLLTNYNPVIPFAISILFVAHPLHTEVVANIKGRDEIFCLLFLCSTINWLLHYLKNNNKINLLISLLCFVLALLSKEMAITFVLVIPLTLYFFKNMEIKKIMIYGLWYASIAVIYLLIRNMLLDSIGDVKYFNSYFQYASDNSGRLATAVYCIIKNILLMAYPHPLVYDYSYNHIPVIAWSDFSAWGSLIVLISMIAFALLNFKKNYFFSFGILYFFITFSLVANIIIPMAAIMAERFLYIPSLGFCFILVILTAKLSKISLNGNYENKKNNSIFLILLTIIIAGYSYKTYARNFDWKDNITIFSKDIHNLPQNARAHFNLGREYAMTAQNETIKDNNLVIKAKDELHKSIDIDPKFYDALFLLAIVNANERNYEEAIMYYQKAIANKPQQIDPKISIETAYINIGINYEKLGRYEEAIENYKKVLSFTFNDYPGQKNNFMYAYNNLCNLYNLIGNHKQAIMYGTKAIEINPRYVKGHFNLANAYLNNREYRKAIENYNKVLYLDNKHSDTYNNIGIASLYIEDYENAAKYLEVALNYNSESKNICKNLSFIYQKLGNTEKANYFFNKTKN